MATEKAEIRKTSDESGLLSKSLPHNRKNNLLKGGTMYVNTSSPYNTRISKLHEEFEKGEGQTSGWTIIEDRHKTKLILELIGDSDKMNIIHAVMELPMAILDILERCKIPKTSAYRKINELIQYGFLVFCGYGISSDRRKVKKYRAYFTKARIEVEKDHTVVMIQLTKFLQPQY